MEKLQNFLISNAPPSAYYIPDFIDENEEQVLWDRVYSAPKPKWVTLKHRRLQIWGGLPTKSGMLAESLPSWLTTSILPRFEKLEIFAECEKFQLPNQCLINEYQSGQGIMPHEDGPFYYPTVATLSLKSHTVLNFYKHHSEENRCSDQKDFMEGGRINPEFSLFLEPRSLLVLQNDLYKNYLHGIEEIFADQLNQENILNLDERKQDKENKPISAGNLGMILKRAASGSDMSKKKVPKGAFHSSAGGSFFQKKRVVLNNVKHLGGERNVFLYKPGSGSMYSDLKSESNSGENNIAMEDINSGFFLGSATNTPKAKKVNTSVVLGSPLGFSNYSMNNNEIMLPSYLSIFTFEESINITTLLAREKGIFMNTNLKKQSIHSDWAVVIKKISMDMPKEIIVAAVSEFAVGDHETWAFRNQFRVLLFTLLMETMAHDLGTLLDRAGGKTCVINCSVNTGNRIYCAVIGFESEEDLESAYCIEPIFGGVKLSWTKMDLVQCERCGKFGHSVLECDVTITSTSKPFKPFKKNSSEENCLCLAKLYAKKNVVTDNYLGSQIK
ncbi:hypothetical protein G9A89_018449 [Geosiphon pyriformis]|nr:hypothetical protein G9A89_018449 [Geosiphon pyriformis]